MKRPFDFIHGEKVDVNNPEHQKVIIDRNNKLQKALNLGLLDFNTSIRLEVELECPKCGSENEGFCYLDLDDEA